MNFELLGIVAVATRLGLTVDRVRQLDDELKPVRIGRKTRVYHSGLVEAYVEKRAADRAARATR